MSRNVELGPATRSWAPGHGESWPPAHSSGPRRGSLPGLLRAALSPISVLLPFANGREETKNAETLAPTSLSEPSVSLWPPFCLSLCPEHFQTFESLTWEEETGINQLSDPLFPTHPLPLSLNVGEGCRGSRPCGRVGIRGGLCGRRGGLRERRGWRASPPGGTRLALLPPGGSRKRWAPAATPTGCVLRGSLPGPARGRRRRRRRRPPPERGWSETVRSAAFQ